MFDAALPRGGFVPRGWNVREYAGRRWNETEHDLDRVFIRDGVAYGAERWWWRVNRTGIHAPWGLSVRKEWTVSGPYEYKFVWHAARGVRQLSVGARCAETGQAVAFIG